MRLAPLVAVALLAAGCGGKQAGLEDARTACRDYAQAVAGGPPRTVEALRREAVSQALRASALAPRWQPLLAGLETTARAADRIPAARAAGNTAVLRAQRSAYAAADAQVSRACQAAGVTVHR